MAVSPGRQLLYDAAGRRRPDAEVLGEVGENGLRTALLADAVHRRAREIEPPSSPPHAVISHPPGTDERDLAGRLRELGWIVHVEPRRDQPMTVTEFDLGVAVCRLFVAVLTPECRYGPYDEIQVALSLPYVHTLAVLRDGADHPVAFHRVICEPGALAESYRYTGGWLPDEAEAMIRKEARAAAAAQPPAEGHAEIVAALAEKAPWLGGLWLHLVDIRRRLGNEPGVIEAARRGAAHAPVWEGRETLRDVENSHLYDDGQFEEAFRSAIETVREFPRNWLARLVVGSLLDDLRRPWTGRNHLLLALRAPGRSAQVVTALGVVYLHLGALSRAERCFRDALAEDPANTVARQNLSLVGHLPRGDESEVLSALGCTACDSVHGDARDARPCAGCGAPRVGGGLCSLCGAAGIAVEGEVCPVCRTGQLAFRERIPL